MSRAVFDPTYPAAPSTVGEHIRKARMDAGLQIKQAARLAGLHEMTIVNWEHGRSRPSQEKLVLFERALKQHAPSSAGMTEDFGRAILDS